MWHTDDYDDSLHLQCDPSLWHFANFPWFPNVNEGAIWRDSGFPFPTTHFLGWGRWSYLLSLAEFIQRHFFKRIFAMWSISASLTWSKKSTAAFLPLGLCFCVAGCGWGTFKFKAHIFFDPAWSFEKGFTAPLFLRHIQVNSAMGGGRLVDFAVHLPQAKGISVYLDPKTKLLPVFLTEYFGLQFYHVIEGLTQQVVNKKSPFLPKVFPFFGS